MNTLIAFILGLISLLAPNGGVSNNTTAFDSYTDEVIIQRWYAKSDAWKQKTCDLYQKQNFKGYNKTYKRMKNMLKPLPGWDKEETRGLVSYAIVYILPDC